ncbi:MOSC domain-containing protein [Actinomycetospora sp. TBRC 11914]|uniref:MOSC domain-containing protein n=1 Tax=Actinomycetospora sp. TBRC 11914 TaxID=2729387 RepID=UPI00145FA374|nr:MOSC N-terminal beta barrel domain-containing protein [Actinomycetospora sp. TBRC 11914]NMO92698.1 MOSC domain-containing protein [Actinomycetospora sp. TBRC 11914]
MQVSTLTRYPVKSMLGQQVEEAVVGTTGLERDRWRALMDPATGYVCTAKHPRLWRRLLQYSAAARDDHVLVTTPGGETLDADDPRLVETLTADLGRPVEIHDRRPPSSSVERPDPEEVLAQGVEAEVEAPTLEISQGTAGDTFVDHSPVHLITTATLEHLGVEARRYRPNLVIAADVAPFAENDWLGRELHVGEVVLRLTLPTPRCSVPTLEHGDLPRNPDALRPLLTGNRVEVPGFGVLPCAGAYAEVVRPGVIRRGDEVRERS